MKILRRSSAPALTIDDARALRPNFTSLDTLPANTSRIALGAAVPVRSCRLEFLFDYDVFPPSIIGADVQWRNERRPMRMGDVIVQRAALPPIGLGVCAEFAVRICELFDSDTKRGYAYETLAGHAERGVSAFSIERAGDGIDFVIRTHSEPALWLARVVAPVFTLPFQRWCTRQALLHVRTRFQEANTRS